MNLAAAHKAIADSVVFRRRRWKWTGFAQPVSQHAGIPLRA